MKESNYLQFHFYLTIFLSAEDINANIINHIIFTGASTDYEHFLLQQVSLIIYIFNNNNEYKKLFKLQTKNLVKQFSNLLI